jgi:hypothetical protein
MDTDGIRGLAGELIGAVFLVAVLYMLVRPDSPGPDLIDAFTSAFDGLLTLATG